LLTVLALGKAHQAAETTLLDAGNTRSTVSDRFDSCDCKLLIWTFHIFLYRENETLGRATLPRYRLCGVYLEFPQYGTDIQIAGTGSQNV
jgi:hypothetical protein